MHLLTSSFAALLTLSLVACSSAEPTTSSSNSPTSPSGSSQGGGDDSPSDEAPSTAAAKPCGSRTCDGKTEYCGLRAASKDKDGKVEWKADSCQTYPSGCSAPTSLSPSDTCDCLAKRPGACPSSGLVLSSCNSSNGAVSFGCAGE